MNIKYLFILTLVSLFLSCERDEPFSPGTEETAFVITFEKDTLSVAEINSRIDAIREEKGEFRWSDGTHQMLWSAIVNSSNIVTIGYGENSDNFENGKTSVQNRIKKEELKQIILNAEGRKNKKTAKEIFLDEDEKINFIDVVISKRETFESLLGQKNIRYIEPANYTYERQKMQSLFSPYSSGCGEYPEILAEGDYTLVVPNAKVPWNFYKHNIPEAWKYSTGSGITIGIVDTGVSDDHPLLGSDFNNGFSRGRIIEKYSTYVNSFFPWETDVTSPVDLCGHGTKMVSVAVAPRNNKGFPVGVAYNANLITYKASTGVYIGLYQSVRGVQRAFMGLANNDKVKIISMSMGTMGIIPLTKIEDAVKYAYHKGKLIFSAAGTSLRITSGLYGVIFPATMKEVVAVTGLKDGVKLQSCDECHSGKQVDFTVVMQRSDTKKTVPVLGMNQAYEQYVGGSSVATATMAGVAALVWSKNPTWTREQVLNKLKQSASFYPFRDPQFGYGNVDVLTAVK